MKKLSILLLTAVISLGLRANPVSVDDARHFGEKFMSAKSRSTQLNLIHTEKTASGVDVFYIFNCEPSGFVIVAADDRMRPILGYSTEGCFSLAASEEGPEVFFDAYRSDLETAIAENMQQSQEIAAQWRMLEDKGSLTERGGRTIGPLCSSTWHQTQLYNYQCPSDPEGYYGHVKVGCVANAMAQIMRYWEWPKTGVGSHSYYCYGYSTTSYGTLSADFGAADYRYELMPDFLDHTSPQQEVDAVALLEFHAGVSVEMSYGANASSAYSPDAIAAMKQYFRYDSSTQFYDRDDYDDSEWTLMMKNEIDNSRPMYYSAYSYTKDGTRGGHAFVCDGYDDNDFFHFNWGWQGFDNGFYGINAMNLTHHQYNYNHRTTVNMAPQTDYYDQPMPVADFEVEPWAYGMAVTVRATAPMTTIGGTALTGIDSVMVLMNNEPFHTFEAPQPGETLEFEAFLDNTASGVVNYFSIYPVTSGGRGKALHETVEMWAADGGMSKPLTFVMYDDAGDGWLSQAISILDERGVVQHRIGLRRGSQGTITVETPVMQNLTLYWNYCNIGYEDDDEECRFEVYDYDGTLLYEQTSKPMVGELFTFYNEWNVVVDPYYITAENIINDDGVAGVLVSWGLEHPNNWLSRFVVERYLDPDDEPVATWYIYPEEREYFDEVGVGTYYYRVRAEYSVGGGLPTSSGYAPNLDYPELDYAMVYVTSIDEIQASEFVTVKVFDVFGRQIYSGSANSFDVKMLKSGVYVVQYLNGSRIIRTEKVSKMP